MERDGPDWVEICMVWDVGDIREMAVAGGVILMMLESRGKGK